MQKNLSIYTGIDIGDTEVRCVIGYSATDGSQGFAIAGVGIAPCQGVKKGVVSHPEEVVDALQIAVHEAERQAGVKVHSATVNISGSHIKCQTSTGIVTVGGMGKVITEDDKHRVEEAAVAIQMPVNRDIIQMFAKHYRIDGEDVIKDPVGMQGVRLEVDEQIITASSSVKNGLDYILSKLGIHINNYVVPGLASAEAVLDRRQKESGTAVIDMGAGTTSVAIIEDGEIEHVAVLPVGGKNITNDLAIVLRTTLDIAEKVKLAFGGFDDYSMGECVIEHKGEKFSFAKDMIRSVIEARVEEIFEMIDKEFAKVKKSKKLPGGVVFVGGSAGLKGLNEFAKEKLELPASIGKLRDVTGLIEKINNTRSSTLVGLMKLDAILPGVEQKEYEGIGWMPKFKFLDHFRNN